MASQKTWTVVKFEEKGLVLVEAIPTSWIDGDTCFWPPYITATPAIMSCEVHNPKTWKLCKFTPFKNSTFNDYEVARRKANLALTTSDLESDSEPTKRMKKPRIMESDESDPEEFQSKLPAPPIYGVNNRNTKKGLNNEKSELMEIDNNSKKKVSQVVKTKRNETVTLSGRSGFVVNLQTSSDVEDEGRQASCSQDWPDDASHSSSSSNRTLVNLSQNLLPSSCSTPTSRELFNDPVAASGISYSTTSSCCDCKPIHLQQEIYMKQIIRKQNVLQATMSQLIDDVAILSRSRQENVVENSQSIFASFNLPLTDNEQLDHFEVYLREDINFQSAINEISKIGGQTPYDFVRRCLSRLMTDGLAKEYSWQGAKKKKVFGSLKVADLIIQAALRNPATSFASIKETELAVKSWLRRAKERHEAKQKVRGIRTD